NRRVTPRLYLSADKREPQPAIVPATYDYSRISLCPRLGLELVRQIAATIGLNQPWSRFYSFLLRLFHASKPNVIRAALRVALAAAAGHVALAVVVAAQIRAAALHALGEAGLGRIIACGRALGIS